MELKTLLHTANRGWMEAVRWSSPSLNVHWTVNDDDTVELNEVCALTGCADEVAHDVVVRIVDSYDETANDADQIDGAYRAVESLKGRLCAVGLAILTLDAEPEKREALLNWAFGQ